MLNDIKSYLNSIVIRYFECLREKVNAQHNIDKPHGVPTERSAHHNAGGCFCRYNQVLWLRRCTLVVDSNIVSLVLFRNPANDLQCK